MFRLALLAAMIVIVSVDCPAKAAGKSPSAPLSTGGAAEAPAGSLPDPNGSVVSPSAPDAGSVSDAARAARREITEALGQAFIFGTGKVRASDPMSPVGQRLNALGLNPTLWRGIETGSATIPLVEGFLSLLAESIPGGEPELGLFVDPHRFAVGLPVIQQAWQERPSSELQHANLDTYLASLKGRTLITVGHIEDGAYVIERPPGGCCRKSVKIRDLLLKAREHGVALLPLGCRSGAAGAPVGVLREIDPEEVAAVLRAIPNGSSVTYAQLFTALEPLGPHVVLLAETVDAYRVRIGRDTGGFASELLAGDVSGYVNVPEIVDVPEIDDIDRAGSVTTDGDEEPIPVERYNWGFPLSIILGSVASFAVGVCALALAQSNALRRRLLGLRGLVLGAAYAGVGIGLLGGSLSVMLILSLYDGLIVGVLIAIAIVVQIVRWSAILVMRILGLRKKKLYRFLTSHGAHGHS